MVWAISWFYVAFLVATSSGGRKNATPLLLNWLPESCRCSSIREYLNMLNLKKTGVHYLVIKILSSSVKLPWASSDRLLLYLKIESVIPRQPILGTSSYSPCLFNYRDEILVWNYMVKSATAHDAHQYVPYESPCVIAIK